MTSTPLPRLWVDVETTGLGYETSFPYTDRPDVTLEVAAILTKPDGTVIGRFGPLVMHATPEELARMDEYVRAMHTRTGLLERVQASTLTRAEVDQALDSWLTDHGIGPRGALLAGNSVALDALFLRRCHPLTFGHLGYRVVDVSTLKEEVRPYYPEVVASVEAEKAASPLTHTALGDIEASRRELAIYRRVLGLRGGLVRMTPNAPHRP